MGAGRTGFGGEFTFQLLNSIRHIGKEKRIYEESEISERSRHRYEVNPKYISKIEDKEFKFTGYNKSKNLIEVCELENHPFYIGVQYHPEFNAKPLRPSKLFSAFIKSIIKIKN